MQSSMQRPQSSCSVAPRSLDGLGIDEQLQRLEQQLESIYPTSAALTYAPNDTIGVPRYRRWAQAVTEAATELPRKLRPWHGFVGLSLALSVGAASLGFTLQQRYGDRALTHIPLQTEAIDGQHWVGQDISFRQRQGNQFDVSFTLSDGESTAQLGLDDIDLTLLMPKVPAIAQGNQQLTKWFLTEREFNRQRVVFEPGSPHISLPDQLTSTLANYNPEDISIALTNNCLGAGYWELALSVATADGGTKKVYQGYFTFPRGAYAQILSLLNPTSYWQQLRNLEAWPGFRFLSGMPFALDDLRQVTVETAKPVTDFKAEPILAEKEQKQKEKLIVYGDSDPAAPLQTWDDVRQADLKFQSFVAPGIYDETKLWPSDFSQLDSVERGTVREIVSPLAEEPLTEIEIVFSGAAQAGNASEHRKLVISGIDTAQVPQLAREDYSDGVYMPLGFGTPFTQSYQDLVANPPADSPFFSVVLDQDNRVIDYRKDIGINGLVMHRDIDDANLLHVYVMSYERITLVGHYAIELGDEK